MSNKFIDERFGTLVPVERAAEIKGSGRYIPAFLDLQTAIDNSRLDQTYNTPALATILLMAEQVDWFNANGGLAWTVARTKESSDALYDWAEASSYATPYVADPALRSQVIGTIDFDDSIDATAICKALRANAAKMTAVIASLKKGGLTDREIQTSNISINPHIQANLPYDGLRDFATVTQLGLSVLAMVVPAPCLFSTMTCWPTSCDRRAASARASTSEMPPAANPTTRRIGLVG